MWWNVLSGDVYLFLGTHSEHIRAVGSGLPFAQSGESSDSAQLHLRTVSRSPAFEIRRGHHKTGMQRCNKYQPITFPWLRTSKPVWEFPFKWTESKRVSLGCRGCSWVALRRLDQNEGSTWSLWKECVHCPLEPRSHLIITTGLVWLFTPEL